MSAAHEDSDSDRFDADAPPDMPPAKAMVNEYLAAVAAEPGKSAPSDSNALYWIDVLRQECTASPAFLSEVQKYIHSRISEEPVHDALGALDRALPAPKTMPPA